MINAIFITGSAVFVAADIIVTIRALHRANKKIEHLDDANRQMWCTNNYLTAQIDTMKKRKNILHGEILKLTEELSTVREEKDKELEIVRAANLTVSQDLDAARAENEKLQESIKQLKLQLAASDNKYKKAAEHINVLRMEINRKQNRKQRNK